LTCKVKEKEGKKEAMYPHNSIVLVRIMGQYAWGCWREGLLVKRTIGPWSPLHHNVCSFFNYSFEVVGDVTVQQVHN